MNSWATTRPSKAAKTLSDEALSERRSLVERAKAGVPGAVLEFYTLNKGLFENIVAAYKKWVPSHLHGDMRQEGFYGLLRGLQKYDPQRATTTKPEGYIFSWVRAYVSNFARNNGIASAANQESIYAAGDEGEEINILDLEYERWHSEAESSPEAKLIAQDVTDVMDSINKILLPKERVVAKRRLFADVPDTLERIGRDLGVSRERIRQIEIDVHRKIERGLQRRTIIVDR